MSYFTQEIERLQKMPVKSKKDTILTLSVPWGAGNTLMRIIDACTVSAYNSFCPEYYIANCAKQPYEESAKFNWYPPTGWILHWRTNGVMFNSLANTVIDKTSLKYIYSLRDPRDVSVSRYFSEIYSHSGPADPEANAQYLARSEAMRKMGVDAYCLETITELLSHYAAIRQFFANIPAERQLFVSYNCLVIDTPAFVEAVANFTDSDLNLQAKADLATAESIDKPEMSQNYLLQLHHASPVPGRFRGELQKETQGKLNDICRECLDWLKRIDEQCYRGLYT